MPPIQPPMNRPMPPMPRPTGMGMMGNNQNPGWRDAYSMPGNSMYRDDQRPTLPGFYISSPQNISARDVPMDGSISFFPSADLSYIIIKQWNGNGMISEARYVLEDASTTQQQTNSQDNSDTPDDSNQQQTDQGSEIVQVVAAALNEQTERLTAAFSQIGMAFTTIQQKLDTVGQVPVPAPEPVKPKSDTAFQPSLPMTESVIPLGPETEDKAKRGRKTGGKE